MNRDRHLSETDLLALEDGRTGAEEAAAARAHVEACPACGSLAEAMRAESAALRAVLAPEPAEAAAVRRADSREPGLAAAAGLALSLGLVAIRWIYNAASDTVADVPVPGLLSMLWSLGAALSSPLLLQELTRYAIYGGILAMALFGLALGRSLLRPASARRGAGPTASGVVVLLALSAAPADAARFEIRTEGHFELAAGETLDGPVFLLCDSATIAGTIRGDLYAACQNVDISGRVEGDVIGVGGSYEISGTVDLSVRTAQGRLELDGVVGRNITAAGEHLEVSRSGRVGGALFLAGSSISISGPVGGPIRAAGDRMLFDAPAEGDVAFYGSELTVGSNASSAGPIRHHGGVEPESEPGAPPVEWTESEPEEADPWGVVASVLWSWSASSLFGVLILFLAPGALRGIAGLAPRPAAPLLAGAVLFVGTPFLAILVAVTLIGIPVAVVLLGAYLVLLYAARVLLGFAIGAALLGSPETRGRAVLVLVVGIGILAIAGKVPYIGVITILLTMFFGLGATALYFWRGRRDASPPPAPTTAPTTAPTAPPVAPA